MVMCVHGISFSVYLVIGLGLWNLDSETTPFTKYHNMSSPKNDTYHYNIYNWLNYNIYNLIEWMSKEEFLKLQG